ncbi:glycine cleavage system protein GcvH [Apibacter sp.]|uniref:glycine cleavage system protein GcvH n=1 Tax=Apibacter sp. TaxID=2023709 RepID=UPI0025DD65DF|nr:glycine cleavage system protein GcvH [Apibacter sp.]MCT6869850.1 glycine cleavage system protein GcvH [Apibacter sp.]
MIIPSELLYSLQHIWVKIVKENVAYVGITDYAQEQLGDIIYVDVESIGTTLKINEIFGSLEAIKTVTDLYMPLDGKVLDVNSELLSDPSLINTDSYGKGWIIKIKLVNILTNHLINAEKYKELVS